MSDQDTLNIETLGKKHLSLTHRPDGNVDLSIRITRRGHSLVGDCTITADRLEMIAAFLKRRGEDATSVPRIQSPAG